MLKVEGAIVIIAHKVCAKIFDHAHIAFKPCHFASTRLLGQTGAKQDFLAVEQAVSQPEDSLYLCIHEKFMLFLNYLLRGCTLGFLAH